MRDSSGTALASYTFDSRSRRTALTYTNGASASYSYDVASRLLYVDNSTGNGQHKYSYTYDNVGNRMDMMVTDGSGTRTHVYSYDDIYQITDVNYPAGFDYLATDTTFAYDDAGNRSSVIDGSGTCSYTSNTLNQYTAAGSLSYQYDHSGNMTYDGHRIYSYDPENRLTEVRRYAQPQALETFSAYTTGGDANWVPDAYFAHSGDIDDSQESWIEIQVQGPGTLRFSWKVSSENWDYLECTIDSVRDSAISGEINWQQKTILIPGDGPHTVRWRYYKDSSISSNQDRGWIDNVTWQPGWTGVPRTLGEAVDSFWPFTTGGNSNWFIDSGDSYYGGYYARSGAIDDDQQSWMQTQVEGPGTVSFWWKVSSESGCDYLEFWVDGVQRDSISGTGQDWAQASYAVTGTGTHTLKWRYVKDSSDYGNCGDDCGRVDYVQWTGPLPQDPPSDQWMTLTYTYDASGRRIEKKYDGLTVLKYVYDGDQCIAEYDAGGNLRRKYLYGPGIDEPICMIEATVSPAATYYYHFDGLGSVTALTNASGATVELYDYDVFGRVGASDPNHPNRFLFTGREYDKETGLYYYRARYYKPEIGRFLQADQVGYGAGMNLYRYCRNNPWNYRDPFGRDPCDSNGYDPCNSGDCHDPCDYNDPCNCYDCYDPCGVLDGNRPFDPARDVVVYIADASIVNSIGKQLSNAPGTIDGLGDARDQYSTLSDAINANLDTSNIYGLTNGRGNDVWCVRRNFQAAGAVSGYPIAGAMTDAADYAQGKLTGKAVKTVCPAAKKPWSVWSKVKKVCKGIWKRKDEKKPDQQHR